MRNSLKVTMTFSSPLVIPEHPVHLDALLAWAMVEEARDRNDDNPLVAQEALPLGKSGVTWQASALAFTPMGSPFLVPMTRTFDINRLANDQGVKYIGNKQKFTQGTGKYKGYDMKVPCRWMEKAEAWCVGDEDEVGRLLSKVTAVGKLTRIGYGAVATCSVDQVEDGGLWRLRNLPPDGDMPHGVQFALVQQNLQPPYWDRLTIQECMCPYAIDAKPEVMFFG